MDRVPYRHAEPMTALLGGGKWLVDLGGGTGRIARRLGKRFERVVVLDVERAMLARARARGFDAVLADAGKLPFRAASLDAALAVDAFHHFPDQAAVLAEARRALAPGGRLVLEEFDPGHWLGRAIETVERVVGFGSSFHRPEALLAQVRAHGFDPAGFARLSGKDYVVRGEAQAGGTSADPTAGTGEAR